MRHPTLILYLVILAAFVVGCWVGWRARISTEEVKVYPPMWRELPPPPDLAHQVEAILERAGW